MNRPRAKQTLVEHVQALTRPADIYLGFVAADKHLLDFDVLGVNDPTTISTADLKRIARHRDRQEDRLRGQAEAALDFMVEALKIHAEEKHGIDPQSIREERRPIRNYFEKIQFMLESLSPAAIQQNWEKPRQKEIYELQERIASNDSALAELKTNAFMMTGIRYQVAGDFAEYVFPGFSFFRVKPESDSFEKAVRKISDEILRRGRKLTQEEKERILTLAGSHDTVGSNLLYLGSREGIFRQINSDIRAIAASEEFNTSFTITDKENEYRRKNRVIERIKTLVQALPQTRNPREYPLQHEHVFGTLQQTIDVESRGFTAHQTYRERRILMYRDRTGEWKPRPDAHIERIRFWQNYSFSRAS